MTNLLSMATDQLVAEIVSAFHATATRPISGVRNDRGRRCAIGVLELVDKDALHTLRGHETCIEQGWDASWADADTEDDPFHTNQRGEPACFGCGRRDCRFYAVGAAAAVAMEDAR